MSSVLLRNSLSLIFLIILITVSECDATIAQYLKSFTQINKIRRQQQYYRRQRRWQESAEKRHEPNSSKDLLSVFPRDIIFYIRAHNIILSCSPGRMCDGSCSKCTHHHHGDRRIIIIDQTHRTR